MLKREAREKHLMNTGGNDLPAKLSLVVSILMVLLALIGGCLR